MAVLADADLMGQLAEAEVDVAAGPVETGDQVTEDMRERGASTGRQLTNGRT